MTPTFKPTPDPDPVVPDAPGPQDCRSRRGAAPATLDDRALLGLMLRRLPGETEAMAGVLLDRFGSLGAVAAADRSELVRLPGVGPAVCADLAMLRELAVRLARAEASRRPVIGSWTALLAYVRTGMADLPREQFRVLYLDRRNRLLGDELCAEGTVDHAPVYPREVLRRALEISASALILVHNHPSGDPTPSAADIEMTRRIVEGARILGLQVHDHLVVGREGTASFKSLGLM